MTTEEYQILKQQEINFQHWVDSKRGRNGWVSYKAEEIPVHLTDIGNAKRGELEVYEFLQNPPDRYFAYVNEKKNLVTTWTGDKLGDIIWQTPYECPAWGSTTKRVAIRIRAINGQRYYGTYYKSSGDYCRLKKFK